MSENNKLEISTNFMIAEFNSLQERAANLEQAKSTQVNFFLVVVAAVIAGGSGLSSLSVIQANLPTGIFVSSLLVFLLGFATLYQSVNYSMSIVSFYRRMGRIRRWFLNQDENIGQYVAFHATDDRPKFKLTRSFLAFRGGDAVLLIVNSFSFATIVVSLMTSFIDLQPILFIIVTIIFGTAAWLLQHQIVYIRLSKEEVRNTKNIHFPSSEPVSETFKIEQNRTSSDSELLEMNKDS